MVPWNDLLEQRLRISAGTRAELGRNGIQSLNDLLEMDEDTISGTVTHMMKFPHPQRPANAVVFASAKNIADLKIVRKWAINQKRMGAVDLNPDDLTLDDLNDTRLRVDELKAFEKSAKDQDVQKPAKLKKMSEWTKFWESVLTYFGSIRGAAEIPLDYIFREKEAVTQAELTAEYDTFDEMYYNCTVLSGNHYRADNSRVWNEFKALLQDGPGWTYIKQFDTQRDGRRAILAMKGQTESTNGLLTRKNKAYAVLNSTTYSGPRRDFTFDTYITTLLNAHNELAYCGEAVPESKKVQDFLNGITCEVLSAGKFHIYGNRELMENFDEAQKYLSTVNSSNLLASAQSKKSGRKVASFKSDGKSGKTYSETEWKKISEDVKGGNWENKEFYALTASQKADVKAARAAKRKKGKNTNKSKKRKAAAAAAKKAAESDDSSATSDEEVPMKNAGEQFGRASHKKKSKGNAGH